MMEEAGTVVSFPQQGPAPDRRRVVGLLGTWRGHGLDAILADAWRAGVIICGLSAGMCPGHAAEDLAAPHFRGPRLGFADEQRAGLHAVA